MNSAIFKFYDELNFFVEKSKKFTDITYQFDGNPSVKDCIEAIGIPHVEVEAIKINNAFVDFNKKISANDFVEVFSMNSEIDFSHSIKLRPDIEEIKFIVDANIGKMTKNLRMFGFDTHYDFDLPDKEIVNLAEREKRIILSRDVGLLKRKNAIYGYFVRSTNIEEQISEVIKRYKLYNLFNPLTLCLECNGFIKPIDKSEVGASLDEGVLKDYDEFFKCDNCNKFFWKGSHYDKMVESVKKWKSNE